MADLSSGELISVVIVTYNWPPALERILVALDSQTDRAFEVIVVDDGSSQENQDKIHNMLSRCDCAVTYVWQENCGFRAALARNVGIKRSRGSYLIFLDGDCIPCSDFILEHRRLAEKNHMVTGHRILLSKSFSHDVLAGRRRLEHMSALYWVVQRAKKKSNKLFPLLRWRWMRRKRKRLRWQGAKTFNLAAWRHDLIAVEGFDERYQGWGYEDTDLVLRLFNKKVFRKSGKFSTEVFHLWHPTASKCHETDNYKHVCEVMHSRRIEPQKSILKLSGRE